MKEKIRLSVKTNFSKYGLKDESREKISNLVEARLQARGEISAEALDAAIEEEVKACEPFVAMIQSEADSRVQRNTPPPAPTPEPNPQPNPNPFDMEKFMTTMAETMKAQAIEAMKPIKDELDSMKLEKTRNAMLSSVKASFEDKYKAVKFSPMQKGFLDDAWELAKNSVNENTTPETLLKSYEDRFNKSCTLAGQVVVFPVEGSDGDSQGKTDFQKMVDSIVPQDNDSAISAFKERFGIDKQ